MKVRVLQVAGQECEPTSFARLMDELAPIDYSRLAGTVLLDEDEWDEWCEDLRNAHEREVGEAGSLGCQAVRNILATKAQGLDAMTDAELAEHGLVRLPVDADGVRIDQGDIVAFCDRPDGEQMPVVDASYSYGMGNWVVTVKRDVGVSVFSTVILRHVPAAPAPDTPRRWRTLWTR